MSTRRDPLTTVGELSFSWAEAQPQECVWPGRFADAPDGFFTAAELVCCGHCYRDFIECVDGLVRVLLAAVARELCRDRRANGAVCEECGLELLVLAERGTSLGQVPIDEGSLLQIWLAALIAEGVLTERAVTRAEVLVDDTALENDRIVESLLRAETVTLSSLDAHRVVDRLQTSLRRAAEDDLGGVSQQRSARRRWPTMAELRMAERLGWPAPQRHMLEDEVRAAAASSVTEADFVQELIRRGVRPVPRLSTHNIGVVGYSAALERIPEHLRRAFSGSSLAPDLGLPALRERWGVGSNSRGAWATWVSLTAPDAVFRVRPVDNEAGWRWAHPDLPEGEPSAVDVERWPPGSKPPSAVVWTALTARQRGACAMCSIRYAFWPTVHGRPVPPGLLRGPMVIDHDHATGLVRGLLCYGCNGIREPAGARWMDDVWLTYTTEPPAGPFQWRYYMLPKNAC